MRRTSRLVGVLLPGFLVGAFARADDPPAGASAVVTDVAGTEYKLTGLKFATGTRRLAWLADPKGTTADAKLGPLAAEFREPHSTTLKKGVVTLVPVGSLESARYDYEKEVVALGVKGLKEPLTGTLEYQGINVLGLAGTADGKAVAFTCGVRGKAAVKTVTFPGAEPLARPKAGQTWAVQILQPKDENPKLMVRNLKVLFQLAGGTEQLADAIPVRKGPPVPFDASLKRFEVLANDPNTNIAAAEVEVGDGPERVIAIPLVSERDTKAATLVGFLGEVDAGYKLFPLHTVKVITPYQKKID